MSTRNRFLILLAALSLLDLSAGGIARELRGEAPRIDSAQHLFVPASLSGVIARQFTGFRLPTAEDYRADGPESEPYYIITQADSTLPFICWGDFNGDGWLDITTYLIPDSIGHRDSLGQLEERMVIFHGSADGFTPYVLSAEPYSPDYQLFTMGTTPPGTILTIKGKGYEGEYPPDFPDSIVTKWDSIEYGKFGSAAEIYYWRDGRYQEVAVSD